jgi:uncharacterized protein YciI
MIYIFHLVDKPHQAALRQQMRPEHKAYLAQMSDRIAFAGPLTDEQGQMVGSLLAIDFESRDDAQQWLSQEPFTKAGVYGEVRIDGFMNLWPQKMGFPPQD